MTLISKLGPVTEHVAMWGSATVPIYLVRGASCATIEGGLAFMGPMLLKQLDAAVPDRNTLTHIILTHSHFDHCGLTSILKRAYPHAAVVASDAAQEILTRPNAMQFIKEMNADLVEKMGFGKTHPDFDFSLGETVAIDRVVREGDVIDLGGGVTLTAYAVPGHSRCSIAYWLEPDRALFTGEAGGFYNSADEILSEGTSHYTTYLESLAKMRALDADVVCLPHNGVLTGAAAKEYFAKAIRQGEAFRDRVRALLGANGDREAVVQQLVADDYKGRIALQPKKAFVINMAAMVNNIAEEYGPV